MTTAAEKLTPKLDLDAAIETILQSLVLPDERAFRVEIVSWERPKNAIAQYVRGSLTIRLNRPVLKHPVQLLCAGLHELAHHLTWEQAAVMRTRFPSHGRAYRHNLKAVIRRFNKDYQGSFCGCVTHNNRRPTKIPCFVKRLPASPISRNVPPNSNEETH